MSYIKPKQQRAIETEQKFLDALDACLQSKPYSETSINDIAEAAGLHRGAFINRFGSKQEALFQLYSRYADRASEVLSQIQANLAQFASLDQVCIHMSMELERIQLADFSANRAMNEFFLTELKTDPQTIKIFKETVALMGVVQSRYLPAGSFTATGAYAAAQILVTANYFYVLNAMPALPRDSDVRHRLIGKWITQALVL